MTNRISFTVLGTARPEGSTKAFMVGGKPHITHANAKMLPWRQEVGWCALRALAELNAEQPWAGKHVPVRVWYHFYFRKPLSVPKRRLWPVVKPDWDKIARAATDALTGILYHDDAQVVFGTVIKEYGLPERAEITVEILS
jgi:Holliday junction resolvase RusA-like endonuclease